jgi:AraC family transcriptional regulator
MPNASRRQYEARMHRVQEHIDRHLDRPLDLEALAAVAHFSPYHFHRLFLAWTGQTLGDYLARRRLEKAAQRLRGQPESTVLSIALGVGYGSAEAFARAFKARFGHSPTQWRNLDQADSNLDQGGAWRADEHGFSRNDDDQGEVNVNVRLITREPVRMAYLRYWCRPSNAATTPAGPCPRTGCPMAAPWSPSCPAAAMRPWTSRARRPRSVLPGRP